MKGTTLKWLIGSVLVPSVLGLLTVFGVQLNDQLFPELAPALDTGAIRHLELKLTAIEAKIELLTRLYNQNEATAQALTQLAFQTQQESDAQQESQVRKFQSLIHVVNDSKYLGRKLTVGQREWEWTIYLSGPLAALDAVKCVTYRLHPTFPNPVHDVCTRSSDGKAFPLTAKGWGTFDINVTVTFLDETTFVADHYLVFESEK